VGTKGAEKVPAQEDGKERGLAWLPSSRAWYPDTLAAGPYTPTSGPLGPTGPAAYEERWRRRRESCMPSRRRDVHQRASERASESREWGPEGGSGGIGRSKETEKEEEREVGVGVGARDASKGAPPFFRSGSESYITRASAVQYRLTIGQISARSRVRSRNESTICDRAA